MKEKLIQAFSDLGDSAIAAVPMIALGLAAVPILFVCAMMAIAQLKIDTDIVRIVTNLVLAGAALAFCHSFGLGTRDIVRNIAAGFYARKVLTAGLPQTISGQTGVLTSITHTRLILESEGHQRAVANAQILDQIAKQSPSGNAGLILYA